MYMLTKIKITEQEILEMPNDNQLGSYVRKKYMEKIKETNPEKLKEWRHQAYLNRKAKLKAKEDNK